MGALLAMPPDSRAATNPAPVAFRMAVRTNLPAGLRLNLQTNSAPTVPAVGVAVAKTNLLATSPKAGTNATPGFGGTLQRIQASRAFYPVVGGLTLCLAVVLLYRVLKPRAARSLAPGTGVTGSKLAGKVPGARFRGASVHSCNVLEMGPLARQIWQFDARGGSFVFGREQTCLEKDPLPARLIAKDWRALLRPSLNIAWVPPEHVFLRVVQLPRSDFSELRTFMGQS